MHFERMNLQTRGAMHEREVLFMKALCLKGMALNDAIPATEPMIQLNGEEDMPACLSQRLVVCTWLFFF